MTSKLVIKDARVVSADSDQNCSRTDVVVEHGRISAVVDAGTAPTAGATVIDARTATDAWPGECAHPLAHQRVEGNRGSSQSSRFHVAQSG